MWKWFNQWKVYKFSSFIYWYHILTNSLRQAYPFYTVEISFHCLADCRTFILPTFYLKSQSIQLRRRYSCQKHSPDALFISLLNVLKRKTKQQQNKRINWWLLLTRHRYGFFLSRITDNDSVLCSDYTKHQKLTARPMSQYTDISRCIWTDRTCNFKSELCVLRRGTKRYINSYSTTRKSFPDSKLIDWWNIGVRYRRVKRARSDVRRPMKLIDNLLNGKRHLIVF